jgi:hypothetical protein
VPTWLAEMRSGRVLRLRPAPDGLALERPEFAQFDGGVVLLRGTLSRAKSVRPSPLPADGLLPAHRKR